MFGSGLQVDRQASSNTRNVYVPRTHGGKFINPQQLIEQYPNGVTITTFRRKNKTRSYSGNYNPPPFFGTWENPIGMGQKQRSRTRQRSVSGKKQPLQFNSNSGIDFLNKPLSNFDLFDWVNKLGIKHFRDIFSRNALPKKIGKECGIINLDDIQGPGTHWVCYRNLDSFVEYFDTFGLIMPHEVYHYLASSGKRQIYSQDEIQNRDSVLCGYWCLYYLNERQKGKSVLDIIHHPDFDEYNRFYNNVF